MEKPSEGRATIKQRDGQLEIVFPGLHNWPTIILLILSLCIGVLVGWMYAVPMFRADVVFKTSRLFISVWVVIWMIFMFVTFRYLLWCIFNKEIVTIQKEMLTIDRQGTLLKDEKSYAMSDIKDFRVREENGFSKNKNGAFWRMNQDFIQPNPGNTLRFDYGLRTIKFGSGIEEAEAKYLHGLIFQSGFFN